MNKHIKLALIFAAAALAGTGCTVDDYNDAYLDGFDSDQERCGLIVAKNRHGEVSKPNSCMEVELF